MSLLLTAEKIDELVKCCWICRYHWGYSFIWIITIWQLFYGWGVYVALTRVHGPSNDRRWRTEWTRDQHSPRQVIIWWQMRFPYSNLISVRIFLFEIALIILETMCHYVTSTKVGFKERERLWMPFSPICTWMNWMPLNAAVTYPTFLNRDFPTVFSLIDKLSKYTFIRIDHEKGTGFQNDHWLLN